MISNSLKINKNGNLVYITYPKISKCGVCKHLFSTRLGGVSSGRYKSMNMSFSNGDERENVLKNYQILCDELKININDLVLCKQTHTNNVLEVGKNETGTGIFKPPFSDIDGLITNEKNVALVTQFADCTPLVFCDPVKKVIATSHAGWRGTVKEIGAITVNKMVDDYGCKPENIIVGIGPSIGQCCYEIDLKVYDEFKKISYLSFDKIFKKVNDEHYMLNLIEANKQILENVGIKESNMDLSDLCTACNHLELHSHRETNGMRGNMAVIIELN